MKIEIKIKIGVFACVSESVCYNYDMDRRVGVSSMKGEGECVCYTYDMDRRVRVRGME